jgi:hypothetical protein
VRPAPRLAFATTKPQLLDDLASLWLCSRPNVAHSFASTAPHTVNLLPPRTAQELLPHRHAPTCAATSQTLARLRAVQGTLAPPEPATLEIALEIEAWADRGAEERFAVKAASVAVAAPSAAAAAAVAFWGPIQIGWGRHQMQPSLPTTHSLIYIHCFTPSSIGSSGQLFFQQILIHCRTLSLLL